MTRKLHEIAAEIRKDWVNRHNSCAYPYLCAMAELETVDDNYYNDSGKNIVRYFLTNAATWKGDVARRIKAELNGMVQ